MATVGAERSQTSCSALSFKMSAEIAGGRRSPEENAAIAAEIVALRQQKAEADAKVRRQSEGLLDVSLDDDHAAQAPAPAPAPAPAAAPAAAAAPVGATDYSQYYSSSSADMVQAAATGAPAAAPAAPPPAAAAEQSPVRSPGPRVSELEITASFVSEGRLGLHFREDSDPPFIVLAVRDGGLASKQPQIRPGIVLKSVNGKPVEGQSYDKIVHALTKSPRPLELGFWRSAPPAARVVSAAVVGTRLVKNPGWLSGSSTEYVIDATTVDGRRRTVHRTYAELKILHLAWVEPLSAVGVSPTFPVDVLFGANDETVVKERAKQLHGWLGAAFAMSQTLRCPLLEDALQRALTANPAGRQVGVGTDNVRSHLRTVIEGALPPGPRAGIANVWDCAGFWSWGSAADFIASAKATHGRADDALAVTVPHMLEIGELEGNWKKAFESIVSEREEGDGAEGEAKPGCWAYADEVGGAARFLAKDGAGGGEARFSGLWRSIDSGPLRPLCRVRSLAAFMSVLKLRMLGLVRGQARDVRRHAGNDGLLGPHLDTARHLGQRSQHGLAVGRHPRREPPADP